MDKKDSIIYCGFGAYYNTETGENLEKTASGEFKRVDPDIYTLLEKEFVDESLNEKREV